MKFPVALRPSLAYSAVVAAFLLLGPWLRPRLAQLTPGDVTASGWCAMVLGVWLLCALVDLALHARRRALGLPVAVVVWWLTMETVAAPHLAGPLRLHQLTFIRDVDHRPPPFAFGTDAQGLRGTPPPEEFAQPGVNVVFLGDSFTWGYLVQPEEAFPSVVGRRLRERFPAADLRVANFGWPSSSPLLSWRRLVDQGPDYSPDLVVLAIDMTDFGDDIRWGRMLERRGMYRLYDRIPIALRLFELLFRDRYEHLVVQSSGGGPVQRYFACEQPLEQSRPWIDVLQRNVDRIQSWCTEHAADFVLVVLPRGHQYDARESPDSWEKDCYTQLGPYSLEPFRYFEEQSREVDYPVVSILEDFRASNAFPTCFDWDPHWNATGHRIAAEAIARALEPLIAATLTGTPRARDSR